METLATSGSNLVRLTNFSVGYPTRNGVVPALREVSLDIRERESLAIVGESGSGKSTLARALIGLVEAPGRATGGEIELASLGRSTSADRRTGVAGKIMTMVLQEPRDSLNPVLSIGSQMGMVLARRGVPRRERRSAASELLRSVRLEDAPRVLRSYPFQLSGGMCQRVAIAIALAGQAKLLIADEPTTALDVRVQASILRLLSELQREHGFALLLVSHDFGVVAEVSQTVAVMYAGRLVEYGPTAEVLGNPRHPYTAALLNARPTLGGGLPIRPIGQAPDAGKVHDQCAYIPRCQHADTLCSESPHPLPDGSLSHSAACYHPIEFVGEKSVDAAATRQSREIPKLPLEPAKLLEVRDLNKRFRVGGALGKQSVQALKDVSLDVSPGEIVGIAGETGCGKSTLAKCVLGLEYPDAGSIRIDGVDLTKSAQSEVRNLRRRVQAVFQDARASMNPNRKVIDVVQEPLRNFGIGERHERWERAREMLSRVGLSDDLFDRSPGQLSSGQCQRAALARALVLNPRLLICDEPFSSLDLSAQAQLMHLLSDLQADYGFGLLLISHDLAVLTSLGSRIVVMLGGRVLEILPAGQTEHRFVHPYTRALLQSIPGFSGNERRVGRSHSPAKTMDLSGCPFVSDCDLAIDLCGRVMPGMSTTSAGHEMACHRSAELPDLQLASTAHL